MSADNWTKCPQCKLNTEIEKSTLLARAESQYGKVDAKQYTLMVDAAKAIGAKELKQTLREDYSIGLDEDGRFYTSYSCYCNVCFFEFTHDHNQSVKLKKGKVP